MLSLVYKLLAVESPVSCTLTCPSVTSQKASGFPHTHSYVYFHQPSASFLSTHASLCLHSFPFPFPIPLCPKQLRLLLPALHEHCHMTLSLSWHPTHATVKLLLYTHLPSYLFVFVCLCPTTYELIITLMHATQIQALKM